MWYDARLKVEEHKKIRSDFRNGRRYSTLSWSMSKLSQINRTNWSVSLTVMNNRYQILTSAIRTISHDLYDIIKIIKAYPWPRMTGRATKPRFGTWLTSPMGILKVADGTEARLEPLIWSFTDMNTEWRSQLRWLLLLWRSWKAKTPVGTGG